MMHSHADIRQQPGHTDGSAPELERGDFSKAVEASDASRLVVATYNIRYAVGSRLISGSLLRRLGFKRPSHRPRLVEENIRRAARAFDDGMRMPRADLIALQEADRNTARAGGRHVARELAEALGMSYVRAAIRTPRVEQPKTRQWYLDFEERIGMGEEGDTGVALLSRVPQSAAERIELPWSDCPWRPRLALAATVPFGDGVLRVFNSHIDPHAGVSGQLKQHEAVLARADETSAGGPVLLLGDFNTLSREAREAARGLLESEGYSTPLTNGVGTWRSGPIRLQADWIFVRRARVLRCGVARRLSVSDHWPVWAEIAPEEASN
ncbi:MAG: endonuclease/exonuclease/phosphatase family protein [Acidobacteria bacterium]|nr:endonuclease/exonuclease/phosphatase family protein [Acidobacteriota bacterium]